MIETCKHCGLDIKKLRSDYSDNKWIHKLGYVRCYPVNDKRNCVAEPYI